MGPRDPSSDPRKLRTAAREAADRGDWKAAVEAYRALGRQEPHDPTWALKAGETYRKLGRGQEAVAELVRAVDLYALGGHLLKGIATCKVILDLEPGHTATLRKLATLHAAPAPVALPAQRPRPAPAIAASAPLAALPIGEMLAGTPNVDPFDPELALAVFDLGPEETPAEPARPPGRMTLFNRAFPQTPFFSALSQRHLQMAIEGVRLVRLEPGEVLFERGDPGDALFVVASGEITLGVPRELARLGEGSFFGEIALLADQPRSATAVARVPTDLLAIDRALVHALLADAPELLRVIMSFLKQRLLANLLASSPLFAPFSPEDRAAIGGRFRFHEAEPGVRLIQQGRPSAALFVLLAGKGEVVRDGATIATLGPGDICGEISILDQTGATATVALPARTFLVSLSRPALAELTASHPPLGHYLRALADSRKQALALA
jgi:cAMP-dependent protein kinase regulator